MWILTVRSPSSAPIEYELKSGKNTIGRKPDNDIVIPDDSASRLHAEIFYKDGLAVINDLGSTNGTYVNRERISVPHAFQSGDQIRIGEYVIHVTCQENGGTPPLVQALAGTRPLTRELILESIDHHAVFLDAVSSRLTMILNLEVALQEIARMTQQALGAEKTGVVLADRFDQLDSLDIPVSIARQAIDQQAVVIVPDLGMRDKKNGKSDDRNNTRQILCVPVKVAQDVVALIYATKTGPLAKPFSQHDVQLAVAISHQAALTMQREKLLQESRKLEEMANTDSLTGLHNRRQIMKLAELEFQRARRFKHPLTVLTMDLDDLKELNDDLGHQVGDQALQMVADLSKKLIRKEDCMGRIGGDEFLILLVEASRAHGLVVAERICQSISEFSITNGNKPVSTSISIGIASSNGNSTDLADLLNQADAALRKAKKAGKNQIACAD